ncbi:hypothetical protein [Sediminitomix flava]|uniref:Oxygen tolerance protein BatD n=1 Tax=Sediminitomix flava TaxID=379075 RepID=A0A315ZGL8_SEDFL|nr:hypothetical protein [Sediminitomix flava]PWJ44661.1 hypothetical protein BC781_1011032 [Sediminitomix flava]
MRRYVNGLIATFLFLFPALLMAQSENPYGRFLGEEVRVGQEIKYVLTYTHPSDEEVIFPGEKHSFAPFEYISRQYFPTQSDSTTSKDSVVYTLMTFEMDSIQELTVPVFVMQENGKKEPIFPEKDGIFLVKSLASDLQQGEQPQLVENTNLAKVNEEFNYPYLLIFLGLVFIALVIVVFVFGGKIKRVLQLKKLKKQNIKFNSSFENYATAPYDAPKLEHLLGIWKTYTGQMIDLPLQSYTTKEIQAVLPNEKLDTPLKTFDRAIYANMVDDQMQQNISFLKEYAQKSYEKKIEEVKNG